MIIVFEGLDASGKHTQVTLLAERLAREGVRAGTIAFPRYEETTFGGLIGLYLNGELGDLSAVSPYAAALLFAGDRLESRGRLLELAATHDVVLIDRYVASNMAYQGARVPEADREAFIAWLEALEYDLNRLPRADLTVFLEMPPSLVGRQLRGKGRRTYTAEVADLHERDVAYLARCHELFHALAARGAGGRWEVVHTVGDDGGLRARESIADEVASHVRPLLADS